jgi:predicted DNA-binding transcriptional regulator AlpA
MTNQITAVFGDRRYLRFRDLVTLGIVSNRGTLSHWVKHGRFPAGIKLAGPRGRTLVWSVAEIAEHLARRAAEQEGVT